MSKSLSRSGLVAAVVIGTLAVSAGWSWGILLIAHFAAASVLSRIGEEKKAGLAESMLEKGAERDARQVLANGALYGIAALAYQISDAPIWYAVGIGALAASAADTWATEIGTLASHEPVSVTSGRVVAAGTSGGITIVGWLGALGGAVFIAAGAAFARWPVPFTAVVLGGLAGALSDSFLGATLQGRRWCDACAKPTERRVHNCGAPTRHTGGLARFDNDGVNAICSVVGALIAFLLSR
ncbi:MAG: DUF92 domain-containing protein [Gemmatimonadaceae bacterium]